MEVEKITSANQEEALSFLSRHENTAVFLLGNFHEHGPLLGPHVNSGNFKLIRQDGVICVFCLTRRGNLLVQSELPVFEPILASCQEEPIKIRGVIGDWEFANSFWQYLKEREIIKKETFYGKEINYALVLDHVEATKEARLLEAKDYQQWKKLILDYTKEQTLPQDLSAEEMQQQFLEKCRKEMRWGLFKEDELVAIAELNAKTSSIATVGGVYTAPEWRNKGFAKIVMKQLMFDCKHKQALSKLIIFTGEAENKPAQKLYETLGCQKIGYMALLFGE
jgi:ribosomal protein S18 acetylase RimI-like enzyme